MGATALRVKRDAEGQGWLTEEFTALEALVDKLKPYTGREIVIDLFCGGGGASEGIRQALGHGPDAAVNHKRDAIAMHAINHPETVHYVSDVRTVDPFELAAGRPVGLLWASPDCTFFSKARGSTPVRKDIRDLPWVVVKFAQTVQPRVIALENVEEIVDWGPVMVCEDGETRPDPAKKGETWKQWVAALNRCGYVVEKRELRAADYGVPTLRNRLFVVARRDGAPIVWPKPTHNKQGSDGLKKWRGAAECIDWSIPTLSIFERAKAKRPDLVPATCRRLVRGIFRFVINDPKPFVVPHTHQGDSRVYDIDDPFRTVTAASRGEWSVVVPTFAGCGGRAGCSPPRSAEVPVATVTAKPDTLLVETELTLATAEVSAFLSQYNTGVVGHSVEEPVSTILNTGSHQALVELETMAFLDVARNHAEGRDLGDPTATVCSEGNHHWLVTLKTRPFSGEVAEESVTVKIDRVLAFLIRYNKSGGAIGLQHPMRTVTTKDRFGLVTVYAATSVDGKDRIITDIRTRMLEPRELYRAQGFEDSYVIDPVLDGKRLIKSAQTRMCGNSVCPAVAAAIVRANYQPLTQELAA